MNKLINSLVIAESRRLIDEYMMLCYGESVRRPGAHAFIIAEMSVLERKLIFHSVPSGKILNAWEIFEDEEGDSNFLTLIPPVINYHIENLRSISVQVHMIRYNVNLEKNEIYIFAQLYQHRSMFLYRTSSIQGAFRLEFVKLFCIGLS